MQQATVNLFADMGAQPATLISGLSPATRRPTRPRRPRRSPRPPPARPRRRRQVTISGTATDAGGGGRRRRGLDRRRHDLASGDAATHQLDLHRGSRTATRRRRSSAGGRRQRQPREPGAGVTVNVSCPCSIWGSSTAGAPADSGDASSIEVGVKFTSDVFGIVTGVRFYKAAANTGTHIGSLWTATGQLLAHGHLHAASPPPAGSRSTSPRRSRSCPNTTYVASYFAPERPLLGQ